MAGRRLPKRALGSGGVQMKPQKSGPRPADTDATQKFNHRRHDTYPAAILQRQNRSCDFRCALCGLELRWPDLAGWNRRLRFCERCNEILDSLQRGAVA
jgi:hypothetical protein